MTSKLRKKFWDTQARNWRSTHKPIWHESGCFFLLRKAIETNTPPKLLQFDENKQWQEYLVE